MIHNEHLIVENKEKFMVVSCSEGHYITNWDKKDVRNYTSAKKMYCPLGYDISGYYCVTEEEHNQLIKEQQILIEKEHNEKKR